jgi:Rrf2 family nitric oxide-sensitive transcriptional repressor
MGIYIVDIKIRKSYFAGKSREMMISQTAEYALRAMVYLAEQPESSHPAAEIAIATKVPTGYLAKILQTLSRAGFVRSQRGLNGGYRLNQAPAVLKLYDIVATVSGFERICSCPLKLEHHKDELCALHRKLDDSYAMIEDSFRSTSIQDLLDAGNDEKTF